jgi:type IV pilus assembly protein PilM
MFRDLGVRLATLLSPVWEGVPFFKNADAYLCLDMGSHSVKLLEVQGLHRPKLIRWGLARIPDSPMGSSIMQNPGAVLDGIKDLKARLRPKASLVLTSVPGPSVIIKRLTVPRTGQLDAAIEKEAAQLIPESLDRVQWDYQVLEHGQKEEGGSVEVLLAAVKKEIIERTIDVVREAGWEPAIVDVDYFAIENLVEVLHPNRQGVVALLSIGSRATLIDIMKNGRSAFRGDIAVGGRELTEAIMAEAKVSFEEAETMKMTAWNKGAISPEIASALEGTVDNLIQEVRRSLSLYWTLAMEEQVSSVYLCGGGTMVPGLSGLMVRGLSVPVEPLDPLQAMNVDGSASSDLQALSPLLAIVAGLSLRRPHDQ